MTIKNYNYFVFRTPTFPINSKYDDIYQHPIFREAIFLASADLYEQLFIKDNFEFDELPQKLKITVIKYILRISNRCTPFGLFASCGVGQIDTKSEFKINFSGLKSVTRLDFSLLTSIFSSISQAKSIKFEIEYKLNDSLFEIRHLGYRYIEYRLVNNVRKYFISEIPKNNVLKKIINYCQKPKKGNNIIDFLSSLGYEKYEASDYISDLIENQVLIAINPLSLIGKVDLISEAINWMSELNQDYKKQQLLANLRDELKKVDKIEIGRSIEKYQEINNIVNELQILNTQKNIIQSDLYLTPEVAAIDTNIINSISQALTVLKKINILSEKSILKRFKEDFYKKYENIEIPLLEALDYDVGVQFNKSISLNSKNPLISELDFSHLKKKPSQNFEITDSIILKKLMSLKPGHNEIIIRDEDLVGLKENWDDMPSTFSVVVEILKAGNEDENSLILLKSAGGNSALNLISRFTCSNNEIKKIAKHITETELGECNENSIIAEIVHLPQARLGNILSRDNFRNHEISYLTNSHTSKTICLSDIMISVPNGKEIILRSKKLNKRIITRLSSAHNFTHDSLPMYHFLCVIQNEKSSNISFDWENMTRLSKSLPRVRYKNVILSPAIWNLNQTDFEAYYYDGIFKVTKLIEDFNLPEKVLLCEADNKLVIDLKEQESLQIVLNEVRKKAVKLEEYLYDHSDMLVKDSTGGFYANEIILNFYNQKK